MNKTEAERKIATVLAELERATGQHVEALEIESVDVTQIQDITQRLSRRVVVTLKPVPGSHWETGAEG